MTTHQERIQEQFSKQADTFGQVPSHSAESSMAVLLELARPTPAQRALDIACGPGIVTCAFAPRVASIRGQDVVPAMIERARARQRELGLRNVDWDVCDSNALPYSDGSFDLVVTRFSFHHLLKPATVLAEMRRVCKAGGTVLVADVAPTPETVEAYDAFESIRDPSHAHALTEAELDTVFADVGLPIIEKQRYGLEMDLETQLAASFPAPGGVERLRALFANDIGKNALGVQARRERDAIRFTYPVLVVSSRK